jgi:dCTP deaminase
MILTDLEILNRISNKTIEISPFKRESLKSNSYDISLDKTLLLYSSSVLDARIDNDYSLIQIPKEGYILYPNILYLGNTLERISTVNTVPFLEGKSSIGRLGISIHATAGKGDLGFSGHWTLEISVIQPVRIYKYMPIGQIIFFETLGECGTPYNNQTNSKYSNQKNIPVSSKMFKNKF